MLFVIDFCGFEPPFVRSSNLLVNRFTHVQTYGCCAKFTCIYVHQNFWNCVQYLKEQRCMWVCPLHSLQWFRVWSWVSDQYTVQKKHEENHFVYVIKVLLAHLNEISTLKLLDKHIVPRFYKKKVVIYCTDIAIPI